MDENREDGITFGEIVRLVKKRIWIVLGAAVLVTLIAVLFSAFVLNERSTYYSKTFALASPAASTGQYADGTPYYYRDIVSERALTAAKASDERFADVDVEAMLAGDGISVYVSPDAEANTLYLGEYTIRLKKQYFADADEAQAFISAVVDQAVQSIKANAYDLDYSVNESTYRAASLEERLSMLKLLRSTLIEGYDAWIEQYSSAYSVQVGDVGRTLGNYRADVSVILGTSLQNSLSQECENNGYGRIVLGMDVTEATVEAAVKTRRASLKEEYTLNLGIIQSFTGQTDGGAEGGTTLADYIVRNATIASQIGNYATSETDDGKSGTLTSVNVTNFARTLNEQYQALSAAALTLKNVTTAIYAENTWATYTSRSLTVEGDVNLVLTGFAAFIVSFLLASVIVCMVDYPHRHTHFGKDGGAAKNLPASCKDGTEEPAEKQENKPEAEKNDCSD